MLIAAVETTNIQTSKAEQVPKIQASASVLTHAYTFYSMKHSMVIEEMKQPIKTDQLSILALTLGAFTLGLGEFAMMPMLPLFSESFSVTPSESSYAISAYALGVVVGAPILMLVTSKINKRTALMFFSLMMLAFNGLGAFAQSLDQLVVTRFLSGLPHGCFFGTAAIVASKMSKEGQTSSAIAKVFLGLTVAMIVGVPVATLIGQNIGWRACLILISLLSFISLILIRKMPEVTDRRNSRIKDEFGVLKNTSVLSVSLVVIVGFGGIFCIYTYVADTILAQDRFPEFTVSIAMAMFGIGSTVGNIVLSKIGDRYPLVTISLTLGVAALFSLIFVIVHDNILLLYGVVFFIGCTVGLASIIQSLMMSLSPNGHSMIGAIVQCSFNTANAIGPWLGGVYIASGANLNEVGYVAALLFGGGLVCCVFSALLIKKNQISAALVVS